MTITGNRIIFLRAAYPLVVAALVFFCMEARAEAQFVPFMERQGPFLDAVDFKAADQAAQKLLSADQPLVGSSQNWHNPSSGNSGTLTILQAYQDHGDACREVSWHDDFKAGTKRTVLLRTCRVTGEWKLVS